MNKFFIPVVVFFFYIRRFYMAVFFNPLWIFVENRFFERKDFLQILIYIHWNRNESRVVSVHDFFVLLTIFSMPQQEYSSWKG